MIVFDFENVVSVYSDRLSESGKWFLLFEISFDYVDNFCFLRFERDNFDFVGFFVVEDVLIFVLIDVDVLLLLFNECELLNVFFKEFC